jgi:hypothetical protein
MLHFEMTEDQYTPLNLFYIFIAARHIRLALISDLLSTVQYG